MHTNWNPFLICAPHGIFTLTARFPSHRAHSHEHWTGMSLYKHCKLLHSLHSTDFSHNAITEYSSVRCLARHIVWRNRFSAMWKSLTSSTQARLSYAFYCKQWKLLTFFVSHFSMLALPCSQNGEAIVLICTCPEVLTLRCNSVGRRWGQATTILQRCTIWFLRVTSVNGITLISITVLQLTSNCCASCKEFTFIPNSFHLMGGWCSGNCIRNEC